MESRIKELRVKKHISQDGLGKQMGVSQQLISRIEIDVQTLPVDLLVKMATYFRVTTDYLLGMSEEKYNGNITAANVQLMEEYCDLIYQFKALDKRDRELVLGLIEKMRDIPIK